MLNWHGCIWSNKVFTFKKIPTLYSVDIEEKGYAGFGKPEAVVNKCFYHQLIRESCLLCF